MSSPAMSAVGTPVTPVYVGGEMFTRAKTPAIQERRPSSARPLSEATDILDTDFEDESDFEEYSRNGSFDTVSLNSYLRKHT
jgi:hypothetical protein